MSSVPVESFIRVACIVNCHIGKRSAAWTKALMYAIGRARAPASGRQTRSRQKPQKNDMPVVAGKRKRAPEGKKPADTRSHKKAKNNREVGEDGDADTEQVAEPSNGMVEENTASEPLRSVDEEQDREREKTPVEGEPDLVITGTKGFVGLFLRPQFVKVELPTFPGFQAMGQDVHVGRAPRAESSTTQLSWPPSSPAPAPVVSPASTVVSWCQSPDVSPASPRDSSAAASYLLAPTPGYPTPARPSSHVPRLDLRQFPAANAPLVLNARSATQLRAPRTPTPQPDTWEQDEENEYPADNDDFPDDNDQVKRVAPADVEVTATGDDSEEEQHDMDDSGGSGSDWGQERQEQRAKEERRTLRRSKRDQQDQEDVEVGLKPEWRQRPPQKLSDSDDSMAENRTPEAKKRLVASIAADCTKISESAYRDIGCHVFGGVIDPEGGSKTFGATHAFKTMRQRDATRWKTMTKEGESRIHVIQMEIEGSNAGTIVHSQRMRELQRDRPEIEDGTVLGDRDSARKFIKDCVLTDLQSGSSQQYLGAPNSIYSGCTQPKKKVLVGAPIGWESPGIPLVLGTLLG
ncbi:hypothetical protein K438DRAFT_2079530 [Mycena galopus ATCC 62051]|nr:hypothetical protein K438DRAFT_2079530 [Mycena galopus ATCC 62051]